jgi:bacterial leucyl aminopeptidase
MRSRAWAAAVSSFLAAGAAAEPLPPSVPMESEVWLSFNRADVAAEKSFPLSAPELSGDAELVYRVDAARLAELSSFMHDKFHRCGGFFAYRSRSDARAAVSRKAAPKAGGPYTLDQKDFTAPAAARVAEAPLRSTIETLAAFNNRQYSSESGVEAARWLAGRWRTLSAGIPGAAVVELAHQGWRQPSVVLTSPGSELKDELVGLGGHLDSINGWRGRDARAPGADDNASGLAVLTEAIRALAESGFRPRRTVQFIAYSAEEVGLRGSQDIVERYVEQGKKITGVIQYDMTNYAGSGDTIFFLSDNVDPALTAFLGRLADAYAGVPWGTTECGYGCSDHASWTRAGLPASAAFESSFGDYNRNIHTDKDTLANAGGSARHSVSFARLAVGFAAELAKQSPR